MIKQRTDFDDTARIPTARLDTTAWLEKHAPEQLECECPDACLLDHDN